jgi:U4/U6.U5 tri-snRNP-associated protein 3
MSARNGRSTRRDERHYDDDDGGTGGDEEGHHDDVESFRRRQRKADRKQRQVEDGDEDLLEQKKNGGTKIRQQHDDDDDDDDDKRKSRDYELERQKRMERLRGELKEEDETMAALDKDGYSEDGVHLRSDVRQELKPQETIIEVNQEELEGLDEEDQMRKLMGIQGFGSTKGSKVEDNQNSAARGVAAKNKARQYRQYMNRKNGFNRPLEKMN